MDMLSAFSHLKCLFAFLYLSDFHEPKLICSSNIEYLSMVLCLLPLFVHIGMVTWFLTALSYLLFSVC